MSYNYTTEVEFDYLFKILIIGDSGVGKTTILQRFAQDYFSTEYVATIGVDFQIKTIDVDQKRCKLQVWDTAGQDRFKCVVSSFYRNANGVMICFDLTDLESFRNVGNWIEETRRMIPYETIKAFAQVKQLSYLETSSKTNENIERCFCDFTAMLVAHTNQIELAHKKEPKKPLVDLRERGKVIGNNNSGCWGGDKCTI
ncbi:unnamed protein product [Adineta ricciae]|uniref:Uncharacterized protein n=1 Tax=Adineta ricciae TaxID=249248 RepID=A0A815C9X6_ADIRI|nr:unnamed protein product [Adineta ricciae]